MTEYHTVNSSHSLDAFIEDARARFERDQYTQYAIHKREKVRSIQQNRSIYLFCAMISQALNDAGMELHITSKALGGEIEAPWTKESVKRHIWDKVQLVQTEKEHSRELSTKEVGLVAMVIERHLATMGINVEFPHKKSSAPASQAGAKP